MSLEEIVNITDVLDWSAKTFEYVKKYHSIESVAHKLLISIMEDNLRVNNIDTLFVMVSKCSYVYKRLSNRKQGFFGWGIK
jgi:hypothetical protein